MPPNPKLDQHETKQGRLRKMCKLLPAPVVPNYSIGGVKSRKKYISNDEIRFLIKRQLAEKQVAKDASHRERRACDPDLLRHAFLDQRIDGRRSHRTRSRIANSRLCFGSAYCPGRGVHGPVVVLPRQLRPRSVPQVASSFASLRRSLTGKWP